MNRIISRFIPAQTPLAPPTCGQATVVFQPVMGRRPPHPSVPRGGWVFP